MNRTHTGPSMGRLRPRRIVIAGVVTVGAVVAGIALALVVNALRPTSPVGAEPSMTASVSPSAEESPTPTEEPTASPRETPPPTPAPTAIPTALPTAAPTTRPSPPLAPAPGSCERFVFAAGPISVTTLAELEAEMAGTWVGCLTTPWVRPYWVTITFREDGTYSATAEEGSPDGNPAFYYGSDEDSPEKRYELNDLQDDREGIGQIDIWFWEGNTNRGELRNIRLMTDALEFEFFHRGAYGPLTYRLHRVPSSD